MSRHRQTDNEHTWSNVGNDLDHQIFGRHPIVCQHTGIVVVRESRGPDEIYEMAVIDDPACTAFGRESAVTLGQSVTLIGSYVRDGAIPTYFDEAVLRARLYRSGTDTDLIPRIFRIEPSLWTGLNWRT